MPSRRLGISVYEQPGSRFCRWQLEHLRTLSDLFGNGLPPLQGVTLAGTEPGFQIKQLTVRDGKRHCYSGMKSLLEYPQLPALFNRRQRSALRREGRQND